MQTACLMISILVALTAAITLVVAAFRTSLGLGIMAILVPFYVVSFGNHRLDFAYRRAVAALWWAGVIGIVISVVAFPPRLT